MFKHYFNFHALVVGFGKDFVEFAEPIQFRNNIFG